MASPSFSLCIVLDHSFFRVSSADGYYCPEFGIPNNSKTGHPKDGMDPVGTRKLTFIDSFFAFDQ